MDAKIVNCYYVNIIAGGRKVHKDSTFMTKLNE